MDNFRRSFLIRVLSSVMSILIIFTMIPTSFANSGQDTKTEDVQKEEVTSEEVSVPEETEEVTEEPSETEVADTEEATEEEVAEEPSETEATDTEEATEEPSETEAADTEEATEEEVAEETDGANDTETEEANTEEVKTEEANTEEATTEEATKSDDTTSEDANEEVVAKEDNGEATEEKADDKEAKTEEANTKETADKEEKAVEEESKDKAKEAKDLKALEAKQKKEPKKAPMIVTFGNEASKDANASTNLADFLVDLKIDAETNDDGEYIVDPNAEYELDFSFAEGQNVQFDNTAELVYDIPAGLDVSNTSDQTFSIHLVDAASGPAGFDVEGNTFKIEDGKLKIKFNESDPNFSRMVASGNVAFDIKIQSKITENTTEIEFSDTVTKKFTFDVDTGLEINKTGVYNKAEDRVDYTLTIKSKATNQNVIVTDTITGTALTFNNDVVATSNKGDIQGGAVTQQGNGFKYTVPQMVDGEVITLKYSAAINYEGLTKYGTVDETNNEATVKSDQVPDHVGDETDLAGQIKYSVLSKSKKGEPKDLGNGKYEITYVLQVNMDKKLDIGGHEIFDSIRESDQPRLAYTGDGITIKITKEDGTTETKDVSWADLETTTNDATGNMNSWKYNIPDDAGKSWYQIEYKTIADMTGAFATLNLRNNVQLNNEDDELISNTSTDAVLPGASEVKMEKTALEYSSKKVKWQIKIEGIPGHGIETRAKIGEGFPKATINGQMYRDLYIADSITVEGLLPGESYEITTNTSGSNNGGNIEFYKDSAKTQKGLLPTPDGEPRDIIVTLETEVNQDWLDLAHKDNYQDVTKRRHKNGASLYLIHNGEASTLYSSAEVIPKKQSFVKKFAGQETVKIDGIDYPLFKYELHLMGLSQEPITITDKFNKEYLKLSGNPIVVSGGTAGEQNNAGGNATATDTAEGASINVTEFPKDGDGNYYSHYKIEYALVVKDQAALEALNQEALDKPDGYPIENTATWGEFTSEKVVENYTYEPYVDKELIEDPSIGNGYIAKFEIVVNKEAGDLIPNSDILAIEDELSSNLRLKMDTIQITPNTNNVGPAFDENTNVLSFDGLPDNEKIVITYEAKVLGAFGDNVNFSNTVKLGQYTSTVEETVEITSSGSGTGTIPSITISKFDKDDANKKLKGAEFELYYKDVNGAQKPVIDKDGNVVTFTSGDDGTAFVEGNQQDLGWALWEGTTYILKEVTAPTGYDINEEGVEFILTKQPAQSYEFDIIGGTINISNERPKTTVEATKTWIGGEDADHTAVKLNLYREAASTPKELVNKNPEVTGTGPFNYKWENLYKNNLAGEEYTYTVEEDGVTNGIVVVDGRQYTVTQQGNNITNSYKSYSLGNYVWYDADRDGIQGKDEKGVKDVKVVLKDKDGKVLAETTTDADGKYIFTGLDNGTYTVEFSELPAGYEITKTDEGDDDKVDSDGLTPTGEIKDANNMTLDLGIVKKVYNLGDYVWYDDNRDGIQDKDEKGVKDVKVVLKDKDGKVLKETTTDANGKYLFEGLENGTYTVEFSNLPEDYVITKTDAGNNDAEDSDGLIATGEIKDADNMTLDLGIKKLYKLGDYVWYDDNRDGIQDDSELGVKDVKVVLKDEKGEVIAETKTDATGKYIFEGLENGTYTVEFSELPEDYVITKTDAGADDAKDSDGLVTTGVIDNADNMTLDLGIKKLYKLGDYVWYDDNRDGIQDDSELGVKDVKVVLKDEKGKVIAETKTDATGKYIFEGLENGTYTVEFSELPEDYVITKTDAGADDAKDSDGLVTTGVIDNADNMTLDLGIKKLYKLGDYVWYDDNRDGIQDEGEKGVEGVKVVLKDATGKVIGETTTDANGKYLFEGLENGTYTVEFSNLPKDYKETLTDAGSDDAKDSDGLIATGVIDNADNMTLDLGIKKLYKLGDYVWYDNNRDGLQDKESKGVEGVKVVLKDATGKVIGETTTDANGKYLFEGLDNGTYTVEFSNLPEGYEATKTDVGTNDLIDSDGLTPTGEIKDSDNLSLDLGIVKKVYKLGDRVWYDDDKDGIQDDGEKGVEGVKVVLKDKDGNKIAETTTDANGNYIFEGLENGTYQLEFSNLPKGYKPTKTNVGSNDLVDSDGLTPTGEIKDSDNLSLDLGIYKEALPKTGMSSSLMVMFLGIISLIAGAYLFKREIIGPRI